MASVQDVFEELSADFRAALDKCIRKLGDFDSEQAEEFGAVVRGVFEMVLDDCIEQAEQEERNTTATSLRRVLPHEKPLLDDFFKRYGGPQVNVRIGVQTLPGFTDPEEDEE